MGYRYHFYLLDKDKIDQLAEKMGNGFFDFKQNEVLCIEQCDTIYTVLKQCQSLFNRGTPAFKNYEGEFDDYPCIVTKSQLKEMVLAWHKDYQEYIIRQSIDLGYRTSIPTDPKEIFSRCMHLGIGDPDNKYYEKDHRHAMFEGEYMLHQQFLIHCTSDGFNAVVGVPPTRFEELLDEPNKITDGLGMHEILIQLIYMYKTFDPSKVLVVHGW